jgi:hypothetical protein
VVEHGGKARRERFGELPGARAGAGVDDGVPVGGVEQLVEPGELLGLAAHPLDREVQVGPAEAVHHHVRVAELQPRRDVGPHLRRRRRGAGDDLDRCQLGSDLADAQVVAAEVVAPLGDAVGLVDDDPARRSL